MVISSHFGSTAPTFARGPGVQPAREGAGPQLLQDNFRDADGLGTVGALL